jgi:ornithine cyclodeaminase/alanine dehydrogenase-like protein (mu-crystallin family)
MTLLIREADVEALCTMADVIAAVEDAELLYAQGKAARNPRQRIRQPNGILHIMAGALPDDHRVGFKAYTAFARNPVRFKIYLFDTRDGKLTAIIEGNRLGQLRTGAATGVAAKYMAASNAGVVGLIGTGLQAAGQLEALACVRKLTAVRVFGRDAARARAFADAQGKRLGVAVEPVTSAREAVEPADLVVTATTSREPVLEREWVRAGAHISATGANMLVRRELDVATVAAASTIVTDSIDQAKLESGALVHAVDTGRLQWNQVHTLADVVAGRIPGRRSPAEITLFHSLGSSLWDLASGMLVEQRAHERGRGEPLPID